MVVLVLVLVFYKTPRLRWWLRLLLFMALTLLALGIAVTQDLTIGINSQNLLSNYLFGLTVCGYGLLTQVIALL